MSTARLVLAFGVVLILLAAFGVSPDALGDDVDLALLGIAACFGSQLL